MSNTRLLKGRCSQPGAVYAVTAVLGRRQPLFLQPQLAALAIAELERCSNEGRVDAWAWVCMPDHVHWLFQLRDDDLSRCMQAFKSRSARAINAARGESGTVWQPGFYDHRLRGDEDATAQARYIVANPLRGGLVQRLEDYPYWWCRWVSVTADL